MAIQGNPVQTMSPFDQRLASFPEVPRATGPNDGVISTAQPDQGPQQETQAPTIQTADAKTKFLAVDGLARSQEPLAQNRWNVDTHFTRVREGVPFSRLDKIPNQSIWVAKLPNGMQKESSASVPNKADDLCNKIEDTLMVDPPKPAPEAKTTDFTAKRAAELLGQLLRQNSGEIGVNDVESVRWAINNALTRASSFLHRRVSKTKGGTQPFQVLASKNAQAYDPNTPDAALVDPNTGLEDPNPVLRYVSADNQFVEDASQADMVWLPKIVVEKLPRQQVRLFPPTATVENADAVLVIRWMTLAEAREEWPETVGQMSQDQLQSMASWQPSSAQKIISFAMRYGLSNGASGPPVEQVGSFAPLLQRRMFCYTLYVRQTPEYPDGYHLDLSGFGGGTVLGEQTLTYTVQTVRDGQVRRCREIPVAQYTPQPDVAWGDPMGWPIIARFAGPSEAEATLYAAFMDMCDNMLHPHVYLRSTASVDMDEWFDRVTPVVLHPNDPEPTKEHFDPMPPVLPLIQNLDTKMDLASGLTATAQGLDTEASQSGIAKNLVISQAKTALSGMNQRLHNFYTRIWRIDSQLYQAFFETPQLIQVTGEAGSADALWWRGEDLAGVDTIGIEPGTGTMATPEAKAQYMAFLQGQQWVQPDQAARATIPTLWRELGLPEDPYEAAIQRMIGVFLKGPTPEWLQQAQQRQQMMQQWQATVGAQYQEHAQAMQAAGIQPDPAPQPPQLPPLPTPFPPKPNDQEGRVASVYVRALSELMVDPAYDRFDPLWQQVCAEAYQRYLQATLPPPPAPDVRIIGSAKDAQTLQSEEQVAQQNGARPETDRSPQQAHAPGGGKMPKGQPSPPKPVERPKVTSPV